MRWRRVRRKPRLDLFHVGAVAPVPWYEIDLDLEFLGDAAPQHGELTGFGHQHPVARRQSIDDRGFPGAGAGRWVDDDRLAGAEHALRSCEDLKAELSEFGTAMIHGRHIHRP